VCKIRKVLTRLDSRSGLVAESGDALAGLVEGRLLGVGGGLKTLALGGEDSGGGDAYPSP
jgi:hypothetical protein